MPDDAAVAQAARSGVWRSLVGGAVATFALNVCGVALNFATVVLLTHVLGPSAFGAYAAAIAWATVASVVAVLGLAPLVIRHVAAYDADEAWGLIRGLLRWTTRAVVLASALTVGAAAAIGIAIYHGRILLLWPLLAALGLVPLTALTTLRQAAMQGLGRVVLGRIPDMLLTPLLFMALASGILVSRGSTSAWVAVLLQVAATAAGFLVGAALLRRSLPDEVRVAAPRTDVQSWRRSAGALATLNVVSAANAQIGTILLATLATAADAGLFNVAYRTTIFISFAMVAATYPISPLVARLHAAGESVRLEETVVRAARLVLAFSIPVAVTLILFAPAILDLFGSGFDAGATAVRIVAVGDVVNVVTGFGGVLLVMCGREADLARSVALGAVLNVGLTAALVPRYGVDGAAAATAVGLAASNLLMTWLAWRRLGIYAAVVRLPATARRA